MKRLVLWCIAVLCPLVFAAAPARAAVDIFLKIENPNIDGESIAKGREKWIDILSYSWGVLNSGTTHTGGGGGAGKPSFIDISFTKLLDASSPKLFQATAAGNHFDKAILDIVTTTGSTATPVTILKYEFEDIIMTSFQQSAAAGGDRPSDSFSFNFAKIKMDYQQLDSKGGKAGSPIHGGWNLATASPAPEPSTWALLAAGLAFVAWRGRRVAGARTA